MYCPKCGSQNPEGVELCQKCSWVLSNLSPTQVSEDAATSGLAITSLVLAILSFFTFITALPAIIFGIIALVKIKNSSGKLKGKGMAIAGIAAPALLLPIFLLLAILIPVVSRPHTITDRMVCGTNMASLGKSMLIYAGDFNEKYPTSSQWCDLLIDNADVPERLFICKGTCDGPCNYAMNKNIEESGPASPADMVVLFESVPGWNQVGGRELLTTENHSDEGCNVLFNDLHVEFVKKKDVNDLRWTLEQKE